MDLFLELKQAGGAGRTYVIVAEQSSKYVPIAREVFAKLETVAKVFFIESATIDQQSWRMLYEKFSSLLADQKIRQASIIAFGSAGALSQLAYLYNPKLVRSMFLIDATSSPHPSIWSRGIDWLEQKFPLGLPLRGESKNFNAQSHLQRIRCPVLCATTSFANDFLREQAQQFVGSMPTAWWCDLPLQYPDQDYATVLTELVDIFQEIPAKCPQ